MLNESDCHHFPQNATIFTQSYYQTDGSYHFMWKMLVNKIFWNRDGQLKNRASFSGDTAFQQLKKPDFLLAYRKEIQNSDMFKGFIFCVSVKRRSEYDWRLRQKRVGWLEETRKAVMLNSEGKQTKSFCSFNFLCRSQRQHCNWKRKVG